MTDETRRSWDWRPKFKWFAAEFLVVVTGILVALALGAFFQQRQNAGNERVYLSLLSRDLVRTIADLEEVGKFDRAQARDGLIAYRALSKPITPEAQAAASASMKKLLVRRTLRLKDGTYQDLISTGNLRLILNRELRDKVVDFFESTTQMFDIINKNNSFFVDEMYNKAMTGQGLLTSSATVGNLASLALIEGAISDSLRGGYADEPDRLWSLPPNAPEWAVVKSVLVTRIRVSMLAQDMIGTHLKTTRELKAAVDAELASHK